MEIILTLGIVSIPLIGLYLVFKMLDKHRKETLIKK